jgi:hypothetical protein
LIDVAQGVDTWRVRVNTVMYGQVTKNEENCWGSLRGLVGQVMNCETESVCGRASWFILICCRKAFRRFLNINNVF